MLSIANLATLPFQKVYENCHVVDVTISPTCGVYCNACHSKSMVQKIRFLHGSITTNDELVLLIIEGKNGLK
jgi:predicted secreted protein